MKILNGTALWIFAAADAFARAGGGGGFHGGGGGGFGGGGFGGGGFGGGYGGGIGSGLIYYGASQGFLSQHPMLFLVLLAVVMYTLNKLSSPSDNSAGQVGALRDFSASPELTAEKEKALAQIRSRDPNFQETDLLRRVGGAFLSIQDAWSRQDMSRARGFISDGVFERFSRQIAEQKERGVRDDMTGVAIDESEILGFRAGKHFDAAYVRFTATTNDRIVSLDDESVIEDDSGSFEEIWTFLRRPGAKTLAKRGAIEGLCPSCGAELSIVDAAQCASCKAFVNSGEYDWVLVAITQISVWEFPDPELDIPDWEALCAQDPDLSSEALEDRAAVVFWRWLDARRKRDGACLRGLTTDELYARLQFDSQHERDAAVGRAAVAAVERGAEFERAHVRISWEAEVLEGDGEAERSEGREQFDHFFVFERKAGVKSDVKSGLRAARCPNCGAPPSADDTTVCAYCSTAFNDRSKGWVLADIVPFGEWSRPKA